MKRNFLIVAIILLLVFTGNLAKAQAWERNSKVLSLGVGASEFFHIDNYYYAGYYPNGRYYRDWYSPLTGQINFQGEFGIHKYVGLGFTTGFGGRGALFYGYAGEINIPIGFIANFHFYQLIADKTGKNLHADKLDIYAGLSIGGGIAATFYDNPTRLVPMAFGGLHAGVRYYFAPKVAVNGELGWGKSLVNVGFSFKI